MSFKLPNTSFQILLTVILLLGSSSIYAAIESIVTYETGRMEKKIYTKGYGLSVGYVWHFGERFTGLTRGLLHRHDLNQKDFEKIVSDGEEVQEADSIFNDKSALNVTAIGLSQGLGFDIKWGNSIFRPFSELSYMRGRLYLKYDKTLTFSAENFNSIDVRYQGEWERMYHKMAYGFGVQWIYKSITLSLRHEFSKVVYDNYVKGYYKENGVHHDESGDIDETLSGKLNGNEDFMNTFSVGLGFVF